MDLFNSSDVVTEISRLEKEIERLKKQKQEFESLAPDIQLAQILHTLLCKSDHTDHCGWQYESNDKYFSPNTAKNAWLTKARNLLDYRYTSDEIIEFLKTLQLAHII